MIIRNMTASFGRLEKESLSLQEGLNIIQAPNEWGKSTWCAFLRCMLYGVDTSQREKAGYKPDKLRYAPWSGAPMAGVMDIQWRGESLRLRRETRLPSAPMREFTATDSAGESVTALTGADVGELLTGVSEPVFQRTAFISQGSLPLSAGPDLEKKIAALVTAGEEDASFTEATERLRSWQRQRRWRNKGRLPEIEEELSKIDQQLSAMAQLRSRLRDTEDAIAQGELACREAANQSRSQQFNRREEALIRLEKAQARQQKLEETALLRRREAEERIQKLKDSPFAGQEPAKAKQRVEEDIAAAAKTKKPPKWHGMVYALAVLMGAVAVLLSFFREESWLLPLGLSLLVCCGFDGMIAVIHRRHKKRKIPPQLAAWGVGSPEELRQCLTAYSADWNAAKAAARLAQQVQQEAEAARREQQTIRQQVITELEKSENGADLLSQREEELRALYHQQAVWKAQLDVLGDPLVLSTRQRKLTEEHARLETEYQALEIAMEELEAANRKLQAEFSPQLARRTAHWLSRLTGGRYGEVTLTRELSAMVCAQGDMLPRDSLFLSRGTADQLYLALRLALCELVLPAEDACPIVLDDALVAFDDERLGYALEALLEFSHSRQVILFTCQDREKRYMKNLTQG